MTPPFRFEDLTDQPFLELLRSPPTHGRYKGYRSLKDSKLQQLEAYYHAVHQDPAAFRRASTYIAELTRDSEHNPQRIALRQACGRLLAGHEPSNPLEEAVAWLLETRPERWERLAGLLGVPFPDTFLLYRGVKGIASVQHVLQYWLEGQPRFPVLQHATASWSLSWAAARVFCGPAKKVPDAVLYHAEVPFEATLADILVDDGSFVVPYLGQWEVVAGPLSQSGSLLALTEKTQVRFGGVNYRFAQREVLHQRWSESGLRPILQGE